MSLSYQDDGLTAFILAFLHLPICIIRDDAQRHQITCTPYYQRGINPYAGSGKGTRNGKGTYLNIHLVHLRKTA